VPLFVLLGAILYLGKEVDIVEFKHGIYQRLAAGEWLVYHFARDLESVHGEGIWSEVKFFSEKHAKRLTDIVVSMRIKPLPPSMWHLYSPSPPKKWYDALVDRDIAFREVYEVVIGFSDFYSRMLNRYQFDEEFLVRHKEDWDKVKKRMRNLMGR